MSCRARRRPNRTSPARIRPRRRACRTSSTVAASAAAAPRANCVSGGQPLVRQPQVVGQHTEEVGGVFGPARHAEVDLGHRPHAVLGEKPRQPELQAGRQRAGVVTRRRGGGRRGVAGAVPVSSAAAIGSRRISQPPQPQIHLGRDVLRHGPQHRLPERGVGVGLQLAGQDERTYRDQEQRNDRRGQNRQPLGKDPLGQPQVIGRGGIRRQIQTRGQPGLQRGQVPSGGPRGHHDASRSSGDPAPHGDPGMARSAGPRP